MTSPLTPATHGLRVASSFNDEYVPGVRHASSADRELNNSASERMLGKPQGQNRDALRIEMVDFPFSPSSTCKKKGPPLSWHLRTEEQAEIDNAWNSIRTGEQLRKYWHAWGSEHQVLPKFFSVSSNIACWARLRTSHAGCSPPLRPAACTGRVPAKTVEPLCSGAPGQCPRKLS